MEKGVDLLYYIEKRNQGKPLAKKIRDEIAKKKRIPFASLRHIR